MNIGFLIAVVIIFVLIIGITIWVTNKAYGRKPDTIDPPPADAAKYDK